MKRTTTWVFVWPVRPQPCRSREAHGSSGRAAGAHRFVLPVAQEVQPKSVPRPAAGGVRLRSGGRRHLAAPWLAALLFLSPGLEAGNPPAESSAGPAATARPTTTLAVTDPKTLPPRDAEACAEGGDGLAPAMVVIAPDAAFLMGSPASEKDREDDEGPRHWVTGRPYAIGQCEVSRGQFARFVAETGYRTSAESGKGCNIWQVVKRFVELDAKADWRIPGFPQDDRHPVVCISHADAQAYVNWLVRRTGAPYRLPSEAEWEYAARAGTVSSRYWGDDPEQGCEFANGADAEAAKIDPNWTTTGCNDHYGYTAPVASYRPNHFGLYDLAGNVWEWTADCWHDNYQGAPADGSAWEAENCDRRVVRGGSWGDIPRNLRSADRFWDAPDEAGINLGFRLARDL